jgi:biopolymer transport protein ExbB
MTAHKCLKNIKISVMLFSCLSIVTANATVLDDLLKQVQQSNAQETDVDNQALIRFKNNLATQKANLQLQRDRHKSLQARMKRSQDNITANTATILSKQKLANNEKSDLDKVFTEFKRSSQDLRGQLKKSPLSAQLPGRSSALSPFSENDFEPDLAAIKTLWLLFTEQMVASSKITTTTQTITMANGNKKLLPVTQISGFSAFTSLGALLYKPANETLQLLPAISSELSDRIEAFNINKDGFIGALIDPSGGPLIERASKTPVWWKVFSDAGAVGAIIVIIGITGIIIALLRLIMLTKEAKKINLQKQNLTTINDNSLGRIIAVADKHINSNADQLSRFLDEAILAEIPDFRKGLGSLAVLATVAPLLGLLGTVAGMIETFHAITAYGNSDPQVLSSGISQALLTTKFGLIAAVPLLLLHSFLSSKSDSILNIIEHQTAGLIAHRQQHFYEITKKNNTQPLENKQINEFGTP